MNSRELLLSAGCFFIVLCAGVDANDDRRVPKKNPGIAGLLSEEYGAGSFQELGAVLHIRSNYHCAFDENYDRQYAEHHRLHRDDKIILLSTFFIAESIGGDSAMQISFMARNDEKMITRKLNHAKAKQLIQYCRFVGVAPKTFSDNASHFFVLNLRLPATHSTYPADFSNTYIDKRMVPPGAKAYIVFGYGWGNGTVYWLDQALNGGSRVPPDQMISLDRYFQREYKTLSRDERIKLALLILGSPGYSRTHDKSLRLLFKRDARRIFAALRSRDHKKLSAFCSRTGIKIERFKANLQDLR